MSLILILDGSKSKKSNGLIQTPYVSPEVTPLTQLLLLEQYSQSPLQSEQSSDTYQLQELVLLSHW